MLSPAQPTAAPHGERDGEVWGRARREAAGRAAGQHGGDHPVYTVHTVHTVQITVVCSLYTCGGDTGRGMKGPAAAAPLGHHQRRKHRK